MSYLTDAPDDHIRYICKFLTRKDMFQLLFTAKRFHKVPNYFSFLDNSEKEYLQTKYLLKQKKDKYLESLKQHIIRNGNYSHISKFFEVLGKYNNCKFDFDPKQHRLYIVLPCKYTNNPIYNFKPINKKELVNIKNILTELTKNKPIDCITIDNYPYEEHALLAYDDNGIITDGVITDELGISNNWNIIRYNKNLMGVRGVLIDKKGLLFRSYNNFNL
jgi:hypothetical protein